MSTITLTVNGRSHTVDVEPTTPLLYVLSDDLVLRGPKFGCGLGQCGACTVIAESRPGSGTESKPGSGTESKPGSGTESKPGSAARAIRSCITPVSAVAGAEITTLEGLGTSEHPHPIQQAFIDEQAAQCGYCLNGVILTAKAFVDRNPGATDAQIQQAMAGVLCRCFAHTRMLRAIQRYAQRV